MRYRWKRSGSGRGEGSKQGPSTSLRLHSGSFVSGNCLSRMARSVEADEDHERGLAGPSRMVGDDGFEPSTSTLSVSRSNP